MMKKTYHEIPDVISAESLRQLQNLENMKDEDIDYTYC